MTEQPATEAVETVDEAPSEAVEAVDSEPVEAEPAETTESLQEEPPVVYDWNGEIEDLKSKDWYEKLDDNVRSAVLKGMETKHGNWQRGYTEKFNEMAKMRRELDRREKGVRDSEIRVQKWMHGDIDPLADKQREIDELKTAHRSAMETLRGEFEELTRRAEDASKGEVQELIREREALRQREAERIQADEAKEKAEIEAAVAEFDGWLDETAPDIKNNPDAHKALVALIVEEVDPHEAVGAVRKIWPLPEPEPEPQPEPEPEPEPVPEGMDMMNMGTGSSGTETGDYRKVEDILDQMRRSAQLDASTVMGLKG